MGLNKIYLDYILACAPGGLSNLKGKTMLELGDQVISDEDISEKTGKVFFKNLGVLHSSVDLNGLHGAIQIDLSKPANKSEWVNHFDIITNSGTSEHVEPKNGQYECFRNIHRWLKVGGVSVHLVPDIDELKERGHWKNHCNNYYSRSFFEMLADQNDYEIVSMKIINGLICACMKKRSDVPFMEDRQKMLAHIDREAGGYVYEDIYGSTFQRRYFLLKRLAKGLYRLPEKITKRLFTV